MVKRMIEYDDMIGNPAAFKAPASSGLTAGFVHVNGTDWTISNSLASSKTTAPIGVITQSAASATISLEIKNTGYVWMNAAATAVISAGKPAYPGGRGTIINTGAKDASGNPIFPGGFGTVIIGCASAGTALVKLERMH